MIPEDRRERDAERFADLGQPSLAEELWAFLSQNKKWWLIPILTVLALFGVIAALASTSIAPFIYTLF